MIALNILETSQLPKDAVLRLHRQVEAHKLALAERLAAVGDPASTPVDIPALLTRERAETLAAPFSCGLVGSERCASTGYPTGEDRDI